MTKQEVEKMNDQVGHELTKIRLNVLYKNNEIDYMKYLELIEHNCDCTDAKRISEMDYKEHIRLSIFND